MSCMEKILAWIFQLGFVMQVSLLFQDAFYSHGTILFICNSHQILMGEGGEDGRETEGEKEHLYVNF